MIPATCIPDCFCEAVRHGFAQPINALSGLGFVLVAFLVFKRKDLMSAIYGTSLIVTGIGTFVYHATLSFAGQTFDLFGMYLFATFLLLYRYKNFLKWFIASNIVLLIQVILWPELRRYVFALLILGVLISEIIQNKEKKYLWQALGVIGVTFVFWILDITKILCYPNSLFQGHALWHLLGAVAAWLIWKHVICQKN